MITLTTSITNLWLKSLWHFCLHILFVRMPGALFLATPVFYKWFISNRNCLRKTNILMKLHPVLIESGWLISLWPIKDCPHHNELQGIIWSEFITSPLWVQKRGKRNYLDFWDREGGEVQCRNCPFSKLDSRCVRRLLIWCSDTFVLKQKLVANSKINFIHTSIGLGAQVREVEFKRSWPWRENEGKMVELVVWSEWGRNSPLSFWGIWQGGNFRWGPSYLESVISRKRREFRNFPAACGPKLNLALN